MPSKNKVTYGPTVKKRAKRLLEALLDYVNGDLEDVEGISLSYTWQEDEKNEKTKQPKLPKLVIRTQLRTLEFLTAKDKHEGQLTKTQISQALKEHLEDFLEILVDHRIEKQGKEEWHFTLKLWSRGKDKNLEQFEIAWECKRPEKSKQQEEILRETVLVDMPPIEDKSPDWRGICGQMLAEQKQLTTNAFTNADGVSLQREEIYVPLAIVERKPPKLQPRNPQEEKEEEKLIPIAEESFFEEVLRLGQSSSQGRRIAVIGEPGSGKTTRLQKIADWILEQGLGLPLWVSLADLTQPTIAQYIEEFWLKQTGQSLTIEALTQQKDQIWLLLDGVDEMTSRVETRHVSALLGGWVQDVRVVVTCRVNVWEADKNAFSGFDVFRNLEFSPEQVRDYIRCWFAGAGDVATGEDLDGALTQSENYRLKELIQNPLRLWMLCHIWYRNRGGLPETQAELYGQFVDRVYDWKADEEILDQREAIDAALARLALAAMEQQDEVSRFRLRESWVVKTLGSRQIFEVVKRLGWLNRVERSPEAICVFYHATFQEYFAALGVESWDDFLPRNHKNSPVAGKKYRIFEPQWKQVILLWLGREDVVDEEKEEFINKLVNFNTGCYGNFYCYRAYFLGAAGIDEFKNCSFAIEIVRLLVKLGFGYLNIEKQEWQTYLDPIKEGARQAIPETIRQLAITEITNILEYCPSEYTLIQAAEGLGTIDQGNPQAIAVLSRILETPKDKSIRWEAAGSLGIVGQGNSQAIAALIKIVETTKDVSICRRAVDSLGVIGQGNPHAITALIKILKTTENDSIRWEAAGSLGKVAQGNSQAITALVKILEDTQDVSILVQVSRSLCEIAQGNPQAIAALVKILETTKNVHTYRWAAQNLATIDQGNFQLIAVLLSSLATTENKYIHIQAAESLGEINQGNPHAITALIRILETTEDKSTRWQAAQSLGKIDKGNPHAITALIRILETTEDKSTRWQAAQSLGEINQGNPHAITALIRILETTEDESTRWQAAQSLGKIDKGNPHAIAALIRILETTKNEYISIQVAKSLDKIDQENPHAIAALIKILETTEDKYIHWEAVWSLGKVAQGNTQVITALVRILETTQDESIRRQDANSLGEIDQGNSQAIAALVKILETTKDYSIRWDAVGNLGEMAQGNTQAITALIKILETTENDSIRRQAADSLQKILTTPEQYTGVVSELKDYLSNEAYQTNSDRYHESYKVLWECAVNLSYPDFYQAWHSTPE